MSKDTIEVRGAEEHNLKDIDVSIPRESFTVVTGLSGSGKSSLAFQTVYAEGQRRYIESLSAYARNFLGQMDKPQVETVEGALAGHLDRSKERREQTPFDGGDGHGTPRLPAPALRPRRHRPTVPTAVARSANSRPRTWSSASSRGCPREPGSNSRRRWSATRRSLRGPLRGTRLEGYARVEIDGEEYDLTMDDPDLDENFDHTVDVIVDRVKVSAEDRPRIIDSVETALDEAEGVLKVILPEASAEVAADLGEEARRTGALGEGDRGERPLRRRVLEGPRLHALGSTSPKSRPGRSP